MMNEFPPRVSESLDSMDAFDNSSVNFISHEFLDKFEVNNFDDSSWVDVDGAIGNFNFEKDLDTMHNTLRNILGDTLDDFKNNSEFEAVELSNSTTFPDFQEPFDEIVYPKGDPDAVCLSKRDVDLLQPDTYINDTIIDFYILYLKNKMKKQEKARFHFFNSFFFSKLAGMDKNAPYACDGKSAFQSVRKWTRKVNLFEKDYIFIPVNFNYHWSLIVICHPGEVDNINDKEPEKSLKLPCILHMDSYKGYHSGLKDLVQSYLCEEWKERKKDTCREDLSSRFLNMPFLPVEVPQQENSYDCGLFLLHYLELFLDEAPSDFFNPLRITKFSNFLNSDWFPPAEASLKRTFIRRLIFELVENDGSRSLDNGDDDCCCSEYNENRIGGQCHLINGEASTFHSGRGIELVPPFNTSSMVLKEHFEPGTTLGTSLRHCQSFDQRSSNHCFNGSISMEKDRYLNQHLQADHLKAELYTSSCATDESNDIEIIGNFPVKTNSRSYPMSVENIRHLQDNFAATINFPIKKESKPYWMSIEYIRQHLLEDGCREKNCTSIEKYAPPISNVTVDHLIYLSNAVDNEVFNDDVQIIDNMKLDFWEEQPAKKRRLMHFPGGSDGILTSFTFI